MKGWNHPLAWGGETYVEWRTGWFGTWLTCVKEEVEEAEEFEEQAEKTDSLSEFELPEEVEC